MVWFFLAELPDGGVPPGRIRILCCPDVLALACGGVPLRGSTLACGSLREGETLIVAKAVSPSRALPLLATPLFCVVEMCVFFRLGPVCCCIGSVGLSRFFCFGVRESGPHSGPVPWDVQERVCCADRFFVSFSVRCQMLYMITLPLCLFLFAVFL